MEVDIVDYLPHEDLVVRLKESEVLSLGAAEPNTGRAVSYHNARVFVSDWNNLKHHPQRRRYRHWPKSAEQRFHLPIARMSIGRHVSKFVSNSLSVRSVDASTSINIRVPTLPPLLP